MLRSSSISLSLTLLLATGLAYADVAPNVPGPGVVYKQGEKCRTAWIGDDAADKTWGDMAIQLMTGSNLKMVHLTTVATGLDGNKNGEFVFDCPEVDPYSAVYFFQYSAPKAKGFQWATRFAIADSNGKTTPPTDKETTADGTVVEWGTGKLVNAAEAKPPPDFQGANSGNQSGGNSTSASESASASASGSASASDLAPTSTSVTKSNPTPSGMSTERSGASPTSNPGGGSSNNNADPANSQKTNNNNNNNNNGAMSLGREQTLFATMILVATVLVVTLGV